MIEHCVAHASPSIVVCFPRLYHWIPSDDIGDVGTSPPVRLYHTPRVHVTLPAVMETEWKPRGSIPLSRIRSFAISLVARRDALAARNRGRLS